jgi:hypothetical protein
MSGAGAAAARVGHYAARAAADASRGERQAAADAARAAALAHLQRTGAGEGYGIRGVKAVDTSQLGDNTLKLVATRLAAPAAAVPAAAAQLPPGWAIAKDASGKAYFFHSDGRVQWEAPRPGGAAAGPPSAGGAPAAATGAPVAVPAAAATAPAALPAGWFSACQPNGEVYYYTASGEVTWDTPTTPAAAAAAAAPTPAPVWCPPRAAAAPAAASGSNSFPLGRAGAAPFAPRAVRGRGPGGGAGGRSSGGGAIDPLDPTGTGGRWSDGLDAAQGRRDASTAASVAAGGALAAPSGGKGLPSPGDVLRMRAAAGLPTSGGGGGGATPASSSGGGAATVAGAKRPRHDGPSGDDARPRPHR